MMSKYTLILFYKQHMIKKAPHTHPDSLKCINPESELIYTTPDNFE